MCRELSIFRFLDHAQAVYCCAGGGLAVGDGRRCGELFAREQLNSGFEVLTYVVDGVTNRRGTRRPLHSNSLGVAFTTPVNTTTPAPASDCFYMSPCNKASTFGQGHGIIRGDVTTVFTIVL